MPWFQTLKNLFDETLSKLSTQPQHLEDRPTSNPSRRPTQFADNITPSLSMPDRPKYKYFKNSTSNTHELMHLIFPPKQTSQPKISPQLDGNKKIAERMFLLQQQIVTQPDTDRDEIELQRVEELWEQIIIHAAMRSDLYFYLLIAVYDLGITINKDATLKQHGKGNKEDVNTNACHDGFFPNAMIEKTPSIWIPEILQDLFGSKALSLVGTHFAEILNNTTELSRLVNEFDMHLEGKVKDPSNTVRHLINNLNQVAHGKIDPRRGMDVYYQEMDQFFKKFETKDYLVIGAQTPKSMLRIAELQKIGTFEGANPEHTAMTDEHFNLLMRFTKAEAIELAVEMKLHGWAFTPNIVKTRYKLLQTEIYTTPPTPSQRYPKDNKTDHLKEGNSNKSTQTNIKKQTSNDVDKSKAKENNTASMRL